MADPNNNMNKPSNGNQTMQHEQAKASVSGEQRQPEQGKSGDDRTKGEFDKSRQEKSAIGGGDTRSQTGEPGRARNELEKGQPDTDKSRSETAGQR